jgi:uncharacterized protein involved in tolerance to divalent cations
MRIRNVSNVNHRHILLFVESPSVTSNFSVMNHDSLTVWVWVWHLSMNSNRNQNNWLFDTLEILRLNQDLIIADLTSLADLTVPVLSTRDASDFMILFKLNIQLCRVSIKNAQALNLSYFQWTESHQFLIEYSMIIKCLEKHFQLVERIICTQHPYTSQDNQHPRICFILTPLCLIALMYGQYPTDGAFSLSFNILEQTTKSREDWTCLDYPLSLIAFLCDQITPKLRNLNRHCACHH